MKNRHLVTIFQFFCSLRLTVTLLLLLVADLLWGYLCLEGNVSLFQPLNEVGLRQWLTTYARSQPLLSAWFIILLPLLFLLVVNTLCCTGDKLYHLARTNLSRLSSAKLWLTLSIHLMHLAMVVLLIGYLMSYTLSTIHHGITLLPGIPVVIPGSTVKVELVAMEMVPYSGKRLATFTGRYLNTEAQLIFSANKKQTSATILMNQPVYYGGYAFFLQDFNPTSTRGMSPAKYITLDIRRDPGVLPTFTGMAAFLTGLCGYLFFRYRLRKNRSSQK